MKTADILIHSGIVITMEGEGTGILNDGAVAVKGTDIVAVGESAAVCKEYTAHRVIDAKDKVVMPGLVDCHAHSSDAIARGLAQDIDLWLYKGIWPVLSQVDENGIRLGSMLHLAESVLSGTTTINDMVNNAGDVLENHLKLGNRCVISEMIHEMPPDIFKYDPLGLFPFDHSVGQRKFNQCKKLVEAYHGFDDGRITCMVGPQAVNMCSPQFLEELYAYARAQGLDIHIHMAQGERETVQMEKRYGMRPIPFLKEHGFLGPNVLGVHLYHALPSEVATAVESGCRMVLCTNSIALLSHSLPPAAEYLALGGSVGLGTDQAPGNNRNNMFQEMKNSALLNKCKLKDCKAFPAWKMLRMATIEGARALNLDHLIGSLRPGKKADLILIDLLRPELTPIYLGPIRNIVPNLVYSADGSEVVLSMVNGKIIMEDRRLVNIDLPELIRQANQEALQIRSRLETFEGLDALPLAQWTKDGFY